MVPAANYNNNDNTWKSDDPWGEIGDSLRMMRAVKARFDPHGTLNPGRGPGGI
jgi:FAD/FMN-containing dehydrogenase